MSWKFQPLESWSTRSVCCPAGKVTVAATVVQVSYPPVFGTATEPERLVPAEFAMCNASVIPYGEDSRKATL